MHFSVKRSWVVGATCVAALITTSCEELPEELASPGATIPIPTQLSAVVGSDVVTLSWEYDNGFGFERFHVYRSEDDQVTFERIAQPTDAPHVDTDLRAGQLYWYRVSGVDERGIEGRRSASLPVRAGVFSVEINGGDAFAGARDLQLSFSAPNLTQNVRFGETADLSAVSWREFTPIAGLTVGAGDGTKTVYAQFRDDVGNPSEVVSDDIVLDTYAEIDAVSFSPTTIAPGGTVDLRIETTSGETGGFCTVFVEGMGEDPISIVDNGQRGDTQAGDGIYEKTYTFPQSFRSASIRMSAVFVDATGNSSDEIEFADNLIMTDPPTPVVLLSAIDVTTTSITIRWTQSDDQNFASYQIYRDDNPSVSKDTSLLVQTATQVGATFFTDTELEEATLYYYLVYVLNDLDDSAASNLGAINTTDLPPTAVVLDDPSAVGPTGLTLTWSVNDNTDFHSYRVFRAQQPGVTDFSLLVATITDRYTVFFDDTGLDTVTNDYYYRVYVYDVALRPARSNEVTTFVAPPAP